MNNVFDKLTVELHSLLHLHKICTFFLFCLFIKSELKIKLIKFRYQLSMHTTYDI